jgi:hypothetical protein
MLHTKELQLLNHRVWTTGDGETYYTYSTHLVRLYITGSPLYVTLKSQFESFWLLLIININTVNSRNSIISTTFFTAIVMSKLRGFPTQKPKNERVYLTHTAHIGYDLHVKNGHKSLVMIAYIAYTSVFRMLHSSVTSVRLGECRLFIIVLSSVNNW